jgi:hypothetical protein
VPCSSSYHSVSTLRQSTLLQTKHWVQSWLSPACPFVFGKTSCSRSVIATSSKLMSHT